MGRQTFIINNFRVLLFLDTLLIVLNISNTYSILPFYLFTYKLSFNSIIIFFFNVVYLFTRFGKNIKIPRFDILFYVYILINVLNFIFSAITQNLILGFIALFSVNITFYILLFNLYKNYQESFSFTKSLFFIKRGYIWFSLYAVFIVLLFLVLIEVFNFNPLINIIDNSNFDILGDNINRTESAYFFPKKLSLFMVSTVERLPFFHKYGIITGIFHEPHTMTFAVYPALFLILPGIKKNLYKVLLLFTFILYSLVAASTMNILALFITVFVAFSTKYIRLSIILTIIFIFFAIYFYSADNSISEMIRSKFGSSSKGYTLLTTEFAFSPKTLIGHNFFDISYAKGISLYYSTVISKEINVGFVIFVLNIIFLFIFIYKIVYLLFSKNQNSWWIGLFATYFFVHSFKLSMTTYSLSLLLFVMFIVSATYRNLKINKYGESI